MSSSMLDRNWLVINTLAGYLDGETDAPAIPGLSAEANEYLKTPECRQGLSTWNKAMAPAIKALSVAFTNPKARAKEESLFLEASVTIIQTIVERVTHLERHRPPTN